LGARSFSAACEVVPVVAIKIGGTYDRPTYAVVPKASK